MDVLAEPPKNHPLVAFKKILFHSADCLLAFFTGELKFSAYAVSQREIEVTWAEPSGDYRFYKVRYRQKNAKMWTKICIKQSGINSCVIKRLRPGRVYEISLKDKSLPTKEQVWLKSKYVCM